MGKRDRERAKRGRRLLIQELGGKCAHRHLGGCKGRLEIDHIVPKQDWKGYHRMDPSWRLAVYRREAKLGLLQVLCHRHNDLKGPNYPKPREGAPGRAYRGRTPAPANAAPERPPAEEWEF